MDFLHNIRSVARYEAVTLRRSWFFRLFSIGALFIFTILNIGLFSPIGDESWNMVSIPSSVPLINLYLLNIGQAIVVIFLAADFLKRDKKLDTNEVLYTRSMSNFEYVIGKTWGILRLFLGFDILILGIGLIMNIISKHMTIDYMSYASYLLIICVPTLVFSLGLAFVLMSVIRNQAITFLLLLGFAALNMFYLWFRAGSIFDYMAFGLPIFKSGLVGFDNLDAIINHRLFYLFLGLALVLTTVLLFRRLPQSKPHRILTIIFLLLFLAGSVLCGYNTYFIYSKGISEKNLVIETNRKFENKYFAYTTDVNLDVIHNGEFIEAKADIKIINNNQETLDRYLFSLNPGLKVSKINSSGRDLKFTVTNHIIEIDPGRLLMHGETDSITITYAGTISESFCYPNYSDNIKENPYRIEMVNVHKRQAFLNRDYVLLTPETNWYPVTALNYYPSNPGLIKIDFSRYRLKVKNENGLTVVSQGKKSNSEGQSIFNPESPLTGITLAIGNYISDTLKVDSVEYINYHFPGHDYYKKDLSELKDTLPNLVSGIMRDLESNFSTRYPFKTLSLIEVPVQFFSYPKKSTQTRAEVQPSMILLPEKLSTLDNAGFSKRFSRQKKRMARNNQVITDKELQVRLFNDFVRNTFISGENYTWVNGVPSNEPTRYRLGPSFYFFKNNFYSADYPAINAVFESHLQQLSHKSQQQDVMIGMGVLSENDKANLILKNISFRDLLAKNPSGDTIRTVLTVKGDWVFNLLRSKAGIDDFKVWFSEYLNSHAFKSTDIRQFSSDIKVKFGFDLYPYLDPWFNGKEQPGFIFTDPKVNEIIIGDRSRYHLTFIATNPEPVAGLFNISFRTAGQEGPQMQSQYFQGGGGRFSISMQGRGMEASDISRIVLLGPVESKKIGIILDAEPRAMMINTLFAKNIPGEISLPINEIGKVRSNTREFTGEEVLPSIQSFTAPSEIIVDNEDPGFTSSKQNTSSPLKKLLGINKRNGESYMQIATWYIPEYWQPVVLTSYYGKYIRSAVYTRAGTGDKTITWKTVIKEPGYYDIFTYIGKTVDRMTVRSGEAAGIAKEEAKENSPYKDMHFKIYHDEGVEDITLDYENAEGGWNTLGRYYLSADTATVVLTNQSSGRMVIGDAVKWEKQN
jgi:hypothetical protein